MLQVIITYDYLSGFSLLDFCTQKYKTNSKISHLYDKKDGIIGTCVGIYKICRASQTLCWKILAIIARELETKLRKISFFLANDYSYDSNLPSFSAIFNIIY